MSSRACPGRSEKHVNLEIRNTGCHAGMMAVWEFLPDASSPFPSALTPSGPVLISSRTSESGLLCRFLLPRKFHPQFAVVDLVS